MLSLPGLYLRDVSRSITCTQVAPNREKEGWSWDTGFWGAVETPSPYFPEDWALPARCLQAPTDNATPVLPPSLALSSHLNCRSLQQGDLVLSAEL